MRLKVASGPLRLALQKPRFQPGAAKSRKARNFSGKSRTPA
jgi:hypothetical protein